MTIELRPLGVACNLACHYCYQEPQREARNFRQAYHMERMKAAITREGGPFTLFGGEPLLLPLKDLEELFRWGLEEYGGSGIQTNGVLLNEAHIRLFKQYNVEVGISLDGPGELNDLRWHATLEQTRRGTGHVLTAIEQLCQHYRPPGLITTLHRLNATAERLPRLHDWTRQMDALGIRSMRLHLLEVESAWIRQAYSLSDEENISALLSFAELQTELKQLRFDILLEMEQSLLGHDQHSSCVWHACDPYTTEAVHGVEGNGQSSNCGRTNKDGVDFLKAERAGYERYLALYQTPQEHGGCQGCRFFMMCKGQCPGTALHGDWRNRSELCGVWKAVFTHLENKLLLQKQQPLSTHPQRGQLEQHMIQGWSRGQNRSLRRLNQEPVTTAMLDPVAPETTIPAPAPARASKFALAPFLRIAFVGEAQRSTWQPRIERVRTALAQLGVLAVSRQMAPLAVVQIAPAEVFALHNMAAAHDLHTYLLADLYPARNKWMVIGAEQVAESYLDAWARGLTDRQEEIAGIPACCQRVHRHLEQIGTYDPLWPFLLSSLPATSQEIDVHSPPTMNVLLRPLGIGLHSYVPCSPYCSESLQAGTALLALGREAAMTEAMDWLEQILNWPAEWSALHGIAELKTGIVKMACATDFTPHKLLARYHGSAQADDAARGLSFAYRKPSGRRRRVPVVSA